MQTEYKINVKSDWNDITIEDYQKIKGLEQPKPLEILSILTDKTTDELRQMPIEVIRELTSEFNFLETAPKDLSLHESFIIDNIRFKPRLSIDKYSAGELIDLLELLKDPTENMHIILAIATESEQKRWFRWKKKEWSIQEKAEFLHKRCSAGRALQAYGFFLELLPDLQKIGGSYLD